MARGDDEPYDMKQCPDCGQYCGVLRSKTVIPIHSPPNSHGKCPGSGKKPL